MNNMRRIAVLRSLLLDFFFDLRRAIVFPPMTHNKKKSGLDLLCKVRLAKARTTTTSRAARIRSEPLHSCSKNWLFHFAVLHISWTNRDYVKSSHSKIAVYLHFLGVDGRKNSLVIYSAGACFSTSGLDFSVF